MPTGYVPVAAKACQTVHVPSIAATVTVGELSPGCFAAIHRQSGTVSGRRRSGRCRETRRRYSHRRAVAPGPATGPGLCDQLVPIPAFLPDQPRHPVDSRDVRGRAGWAGCRGCRSRNRARRPQPSRATTRQHGNGGRKSWSHPGSRAAGQCRRTGDIQRTSKESTGAGFGETSTTADRSITTRSLRSARPVRVPRDMAVRAVAVGRRPDLVPPSE